MNLLPSFELRRGLAEFTQRFNRLPRMQGRSKMGIDGVLSVLASKIRHISIRIYYQVIDSYQYLLNSCERLCQSGRPTAVQGRLL